MSARRPARPSPPFAILLGIGVFASLLLLPGCRTTRVMEVTSDPPGALVRLDEEVIGRTPLEHEFLHYGRRRLTLYLPGYRTWSRRVEPEAPWYSRFPFDFVTEVLIPLGLTHRYAYEAVLVEDTGDDPSGTAPAIDGFVERAVEVRSRRIEAAAAKDEPAEQEAGPQQDAARTGQPGDTE